MIEYVGFAAALLGAIMFLPQTIQVLKTRHTKDLSLTTQVLLLIVSLLWVVYGLGVKTTPVVLVNIIIAVLTTVILSVKVKNEYLR